ncbi:MAG TPA: HisA/HisF-related TIM barrel protein, partial [Chloroflexota bacterium]|nr:HisA/HisF-related TIM barrel protein [Chloroflexota bacterium]
MGERAGAAGGGAGFDVLPSIDLRAGRVVDLYQGDYAQETVYETTPEAVAAD